MGRKIKAEIESFLPKSKCKTCGKQFYISVGWVYKRESKTMPKRTYHFCTYGCMRKFDKANLEDSKDEMS